ncbi:unnamed protein product [Prunus brigantina]
MDINLLIPSFSPTLTPSGIGGGAGDEGGGGGGGNGSVVVVVVGVKVEEVVVEKVVVDEEEEEDVVVVVAVAMVAEVVNVLMQVVELDVEVDVVSFFKMNDGILGIKKTH